MDRFHVVAINERTGRKVYLTRYAMPHKEACRVLSKQSPPAPDVRKQLEPWDTPAPDYTLQPEGEDVRPIKLAEFYEANAGELIEGDRELIEGLAVGGHVVFGGGAGPVFILRRET